MRGGSSPVSVQSEEGEREYFCSRVKRVRNLL